MRAVRMAEAQFPERSSAWRYPGAGWMIHTSRPELIVVDEELSERARFPLPSGWHATHCVAPDLRHAAVSERDGVLMIDRAGRVIWRIAHHPWGNSGSESGSCWVTKDGRHVWATVPTEDGPDEWWVLDGGSGQVLARASLECHAAGSNVVAHPDGRHVGLSVGEGQDRSEVYWGRYEGGPIVLSQLDDRTRVLVDVHPDGRHYLTTPHDGEVLAVHDFPSGRVAARQRAADDTFDFMAGYVTADAIIAGAVEAEVHTLFDAGSLARIGDIEYPAGAVKQSILPTGRGTWLTGDHLTGRHEAWRLG